MTMDELWISGAKDAFGHRIRDAWSVVGWEEGRVAEQFVCWLPAKPEAMSSTMPPQLELFA